jgi:F0F1-type ATP synthase delta subunit
MKYSAKQYSQAIFELSQTKSMTELPKLIDDWLALISSQGQVSLLPQITTELDKIFNAQQLQVTVTSARPLSDQSKHWLIEYLQVIAPDKQVVIIEKTDPEILAGCLIRYQDQELNLSLQGVLTDLHEQIIA